MAQINWSILGGGINPGDAFQQGFANGRAMRREIETDNALAAYAQNPDDPNTVNALARFNPQLALKIRGDQQARAEAAQRQQVTAAALNGDPQARQQLAGIDPEMFMKMDKNQRDGMKQRVDAIGQAALWADTSEKWDQAIDELSRAYPELSEYRGKFSPQARAAAIAQAGEMKTYLERSDPKYLSVQAGGSLVNVRDPQALQQFNAQQTQAASQAGGPQVGSVVNGYRFKGGNPNDPASWEKGGQTPSASGNFR